MSSQAYRPSAPGVQGGPASGNRSQRVVYFPRPTVPPDPYTLSPDGDAPARRDPRPGRLSVGASAVVLAMAFAMAFGVGLLTALTVGGVLSY